jgi:23S rRNA pseudouridine1911/1915/1917 synthase
VLLSADERFNAPRQPWTPFSLPRSRRNRRPPEHDEFCFGSAGTSRLRLLPMRKRAHEPAGIFARRRRGIRMNLNVHTLIVADGVRKERADKIVAAAHPELSRAAVQRAFEAGLVRLGAKAEPIAKNHRVSAGDALEYAFPEVRSTELLPKAIALEVIFEDDDLVAINKPPGMVVHPGAGTGDDTLVHALLAHCAGKLSGIGGVERPGIVHRLDRETSGVIVAAKTDRAHRKLSRAFARRETEKEYLALVAGVPALRSGTILKPIGRHTVHRHRMTIAPEGTGREAHTDWERERAFGKFAALLRCRIHTGRTHQIRVHLKSLGHPVLGDATYGWHRDARFAIEPPRVMLHAARLAFEHPVSGEWIDLEAPLPADFQAMLDSLAVLDSSQPDRKASSRG